MQNKNSIRILVNPACSKCKTAMSYQQQFLDMAFQYYDYTIEGIDEETIELLIDKLPFESLIRVNDEAYLEIYSHEPKDHMVAKRILQEHPLLLQRPILIHKDTVLIGRPASIIEHYLQSLDDH